MKNKFFYEFYCENCGEILATRIDSSIFLALGFETLCQNCGTLCGYDYIKNTGVRLMYLKRNNKWKWYNPFTWRNKKYIKIEKS